MSLAVCCFKINGCKRVVHSYKAGSWCPLLFPFGCLAQDEDVKLEMLEE
jgi:hypothetical protein